MKLRTILSILLLTAILPACNLPITLGAKSAQPSATPVPPARATDTPVPPTATLTPLPSNTPTITPTPTPAVPMISATSVSVNCRFGPGTNYITEGAFNPGLSVPILGKNSGGGWWQIQNPSDARYQCWVGDSVTTVTGDTTSVPVAAAPQPFVTGVSANKPPRMSVPLCTGPIPAIILTGSITVNGPVKVTFHFETQQGGANTPQTVNFTTFGPHPVTDSSYTPPITPGDYWLKLVVTSPNSMLAQSTYSIGCP
jgi:hypothetical protein